MIRNSFKTLKNIVVDFINDTKPKPKKTIDIFKFPKNRTFNYEKIGEMKQSEALKILNFKPGDQITFKTLDKRFIKYYILNDSEFGGSSYLQAKLLNAYLFIDLTMVYDDAICVKKHRRRYGKSKSVEDILKKAYDDDEQIKKEKKKSENDNVNVNDNDK